MTRSQRVCAVAVALASLVVLTGSAPCEAEPLAKACKTVELDGYRITFAGVERLSHWDRKKHDAVTNATSRKPLTPDLTMYDLGKFEEEHPGALKFLGPKPRPGAPAVVFEVLLWGPAVTTWNKGTAELEIGVLEAGITGTPEKVRWEWVRFALPRFG